MGKAPTTPKLRGCRYETIEEMKEAVTKVIGTLTQFGELSNPFTIISIFHPYQIPTEYEKQSLYIQSSPHLWVGTTVYLWRIFFQNT